METGFVYLLEVSVCLGLSLLIYRLLLSELTFFTWNRSLLLLLLVLSFFLPLLSIETVGIRGGGDVMREMTLPVFQVGEQTTLSAEPQKMWTSLMLMTYFLGAIFMASRLIFGFFAFQRHLSYAKVIKYQDQLIALNPKFVPSSFFNYILMPDLDKDDTSQKQIILHESMHVAHGHSWDLLLVNFAKVFLWFNPLIYLYEKYLREIHEFQADQGVVFHYSPKQYAFLLLQLISGKSGWQFMNNFNNFQTKKRILMLAKVNSSAKQKIRFLAVPPLIATLLFLVSFENSALNHGLVELNQEPPTLIELPFPEQEISNFQVNKQEEVSPPIQTSGKEIFDVVEQQPNPVGGMSSWNSYLAKNIRYPLTARQRGIEGTVIVVFEIHTDGSIHNVEILRGIGGGADEEAVRVVENAPNWEPGRQRGRAVKTRMRLPIRFRIEKGLPTPSKPSIKETPISSVTNLKELTVTAYLPINKSLK
jgi:TonB family protein